MQVVIGRLAESTAAGDAGQPVRLLEANIDDATAEVLAYTVATLLAAGGDDAWITPIVMKKGRPAHTLHVLCEPARAELLGGRHRGRDGTLGLRGTTLERWPQQRVEDIVVVDGQQVRIKRGRARVKVEHDDAVAAANAVGSPPGGAAPGRAARVRPLSNGGQPAGR